MIHPALLFGVLLPVTYALVWWIDRANQRDLERARRRAWICRVLGLPR